MALRCPDRHAARVDRIGLNTYFGGDAGQPEQGVHAHRFFGALTAVYVGIHFTFLWKLWRRGPRRPFWKTVFGPASMAPGWADVVQFVQHVRWFLFLGPRRGSGAGRIGKSSTTGPCFGAWSSSAVRDF